MGGIVIQAFEVRPEFSPLSVARALWKRRGFIVLFWLVGTAAIVGTVFSLQPIYSASAVILVESQQIPETFVTATVQTPLEARLDTLKQQVLSQDRLWSLIETLNLYPKDRKRLTREEVLLLMKQDIAINLVRGWSARGPGAFEVGYRAPSAEIAAEVANRMGMFFINENLRQRTDEATGTSDFLNQQLAESERRLREHEAMLKEFKLKHSGELPQQEAALLASMSQSRTELLGIQDALGRAQQNKLILESSAAYAETLLRERQDAARRQAAAIVPPTADPAPAAAPAPAPTELDRSRRDLAALRSRYLDSHPDVQRMMQEVQRLEREEGARPAPVAVSRPTPGPAANRPRQERPEQQGGGAAPSAESLRIGEVRAQLALIDKDMQGLETRRHRVLQDINDTQARVRSLPIREQQLAAIMRDYETCKTNYESLLNKKLAAEVAANMERWQKSQKFVMLDRARIPQKPSRPRRTVLSAAGTLFSLLAGAGIAFLLQLRANQFLGEWELPEGTTVLGRVPPLVLLNR